MTPCVTLAGVGSAASLSWLALHLGVAKPRLPSQLLLLQLTSAALVCSVLAGFAFTGTSAIAGHWLYGARGCIAHALIHHVGVVVQLWTLAGLAVERWLHCRPSPLPPPPPPPPARWYARALALPWLLGVVVAAPPLLGWGSFGCDASGVWCGVSWGGGGGSSSSFAYAVFALLAGRLIPATVT
ncbi:hypothetical protein ONE63_010826 [Megalurothrips usitatus]|uniref:G-protein coupled receptors family 1 profile domain-containing protein n=1 Tax=Megalurothrips usitatus TaxID=439358 RepID=A0AAV7XG56_9NEOP|nr:hypothetical protein ONE63_010826 [Megalurothrips usitatus]